MFGVMLTSFYVFAKSTKYIDFARQKTLVITLSLFWAIIFSLGPPIMPIYLAGITTALYLCFLIKEKNETTISAYLLSFGIAYVLHYVSIVPIGIIFNFILGMGQETDALLDLNDPIYILMYLLIAVLQFVLSFLIFRLRPFKNGFAFVFHKYTIVIALIFTGVILVLVTIVNMLAGTEDDILVRHFSYVLGVLTAGVGIYILIKRLLKRFFKKRVRENSTAHYKKLLAESEDKNKQKDDLINALTSAIHSFTDRIKAIEKVVPQDIVRNLADDWQAELEKIRTKKPLTSTRVNSIDILLGYYADKFAQDDIKFNLAVNGSIVYMVDNIIGVGKLETLIANHLNDAQIAINKGEDTFRSISVIMGVNDSENCYELTVFDGGIPFEVDILTRLGTERVTTHSDTGGSGIGFESTFEIMREVGASLVINEREPSSAYHSTSVSIRFDGKCQYIIESYRADEIPSSERYIVARRG